MKKNDLYNSPAHVEKVFKPANGNEHERLLFLQRTMHIFKENIEESFILFYFLKLHLSIELRSN
jgi:hypothetical protein